MKPKCAPGDPRCTCDMKYPLAVAEPASKHRNLSKVIQTHLEEGVKIRKLDLFAPVVRSALSRMSSQELSTVADPSYKPIEFTLQHESAMSLIQSAPVAELISVALPDSQQLVLKRVNILSHDFKVVTPGSGGSETQTETKIDTGIHYHGSVAGVDGSIAAMSMYRDGTVIGMTSAETTGNLTFAPFAGVNLDNHHILYKENQQKLAQDFKCDVREPEKKKGAPSETTTPTPTVTTSISTPSFTPGGSGSSSTSCCTGLRDRDEAKAPQCVRQYYEIDYDLFQNKGSSVQNTTTFMTAAFAQVALLYNNEAVPTQLSQLFIWTTPSPYAGYNTTSALLDRFEEVRTSYNGDLGHLVALRGNGGIANLSGLCTTFKRQCYSGINPSFSTFPTYSWTINVLAHESLHVAGPLRHTHSCSWNGNNTAIDGCAGYTENGNCPLPGLPSGGGTIMSYCHLTSVGINLSKGLGPQPGNLLRSAYAGWTCLQNCSPITDTTPIITLSPTSLSFSATTTGSNPPTQTVNVTNSNTNGGGTLVWTAAVSSTSTPWLTLSPTSGTAPSAFGVTVNKTGLAAGSYNATITVSGGAGVSPKSLPVSLTVSGGVQPPSFRVTPTSLTFVATQGSGNPSPQSLSVTNQGGGILSWTANDNAAWLSLSATSGTAPSSVSVSVSLGALTPGTYNAVIAFTRSGGGIPTASVPVTFTVNPSGGGCTGTLYSGTLSGAGARQYLPVYRTSQPGVHQARLSGPSGTNFNLGLLQWSWSSNSWELRAETKGSGSVESLSYSGTAGDYVYYVTSLLGRGNYEVCVQKPPGSAFFLNPRKAGVALRYSHL